MAATKATPAYCSVFAEKIIAACEKHWSGYSANCSGLVKAVALDLRVLLSGQADDIVDHVKSKWWSVGSGREANDWAEAGYLVVGGLKSTEHDPARSNGHVVIVVPGPLAHGKYPTAYWGSLGGVGKKRETINWSWNKTDRDKVIYRATEIAGATYND